MRFRLRWPWADRDKRPALDDETAGWIGTHRQPFHDHAVGSLVPVVFERYARLLHPARAAEDAPVRWDTVAAWSGRTIHALAQWDFLSIPRGERGHRAPFVEPPPTGGLAPAQLATLCDVLAAHTSTPDRCFVGVWEGYGWWDRADPAPLSELRLDQRTFLVQEGPLEKASHLGWRHPGGPSSYQSESPTLMWPSDHAWFVAGDVDLDSTYVGGSAGLITALLAHPALEGWPADPGDRISIDSDSINPGTG